MAASISRARTDGFAAYNVAFSPFFANKIAVAGAANFGLVGNGRLSVLGTGPGNQMTVERGFDSQDGIFDVAWSEVHENQLATGSGDGHVKLWDVQVNGFPVKKWKEHSKEVFSVDWSNVEKNLFCSASWDCSVKVWSPEQATSLLTIPAHGLCVYNARFAPSQPATIASCSSDGSLKLWDTRAPIVLETQGPVPVAKAPISITAHPAEVLSLDWNKYKPFLIATSSSDRTVRVHDIRMAGAAASTQAQPSAVPRVQPAATVASIIGHEYAVRCVKWSPHSSDLIATASYDMTARIWSLDTNRLATQQSQVSPFGATGMGGAQLQKVHNQHTEFVMGLSWSYFTPGLIASCSWDQFVDLWM